MVRGKVKAGFDFGLDLHLKNLEDGSLVKVSLENICDHEPDVERFSIEKIEGGDSSDVT